MDHIRRFYDDHIPAQPSLHTSQASPRQSQPAPDLSVIFSLAFITSVLVTLVSIGTDKPRLENHPMCGTTTGGQVRNTILLNGSQG